GEAGLDTERERKGDAVGRDPRGGEAAALRAAAVGIAAARAELVRRRRRLAHRRSSHPEQLVRAGNRLAGDDRLADHAGRRCAYGRLNARAPGGSLRIADEGENVLVDLLWPVAGDGPSHDLALSRLPPVLPELHGEIRRG